MDNFTATMIAEGAIEADDYDHYIAAWQHLLNTGLCWQLQGWFGRQAKAMLDDDLIALPRPPSCRSCGE